jgi:hypothetical protein
MWDWIAAGAAGVAGAVGGTAYDDYAQDSTHQPDRPYRPTEPDEVGDSSYAPGWEPTDEETERWDETWRRRQPEYWRSTDPNVTWFEDFRDWARVWGQQMEGTLGRDPSAPSGTQI